ncbi:MAG: GxxExxY protein [Thermodesulfovibrionia bacterium]|nr:GxxExxY protein [Thermodesulfovibrionia bacterium]
MLYFVDFIWKRVFPKLPFFKKIYFAVSKGRNRALSLTEGLGRISFCGFDELSNKVIGCALEVHRNLGPGLLESIYEQCLAYELKTANISFKLQHSLPVEYKNIKLDCGYRIDVLIDDSIIVELKSVDKILPIHPVK